jgi:hypothetical protein
MQHVHDIAKRLIHLTHRAVGRRLRRLTPTGTRNILRPRSHPTRLILDRPRMHRHDLEQTITRGKPEQLLRAERRRTPCDTAIGPIMGTGQCTDGPREGRTATVLAALEPHRQIIGDGVHRDPVLRHGVALAHGNGVVVE